MGDAERFLAQLKHEKILIFGQILGSELRTFHHLLVYLKDLILVDRHCYIFATFIFNKIMENLFLLFEGNTI